MLVVLFISGAMAFADIEHPSGMLAGRRLLADGGSAGGDGVVGGGVLGAIADAFGLTGNLLGDLIGKDGGN